MRRRAETISVGRVEESTEQVGCSDDLLLAGRKAQRMFAGDDGVKTIAQACDFHHNIMHIGCFINEMDIEPVRAFVQKVDVQWAKGAFQAVPSRLRFASRVDDTPAGAGQQILQGPDQSALAG